MTHTPSDATRGGQAKGTSKLDCLLRIGELQRDKTWLLFDSDRLRRQGNLEAAVDSYQRLIDTIREELAVAEAHNARFEPPYEIDSIVGPLVNAITSQADVLHSLGLRGQAAERRTEAIDLARRYFGERGDAREQRGRAATLTTEGRFNEALTALASSRDFFEAEGDVIQTARTTVDLADLLSWLGDHERGLDEIEHARALIAPFVAEVPPSRASVMRNILGGLSDIAAGKGDGSSATNAVEIYRVAVELDYFGGLLAKSRGELERAWGLFERVYDHYAGLGVAAAIDYQFADLRARMGEYDDSVARFSALEETFLRDRRLLPKYPALCRGWAEALLHRGEVDRALAIAETGLEHLKRGHDPDVLWKLHATRGRILVAAGEPQEAQSAYREACDTIDTLRASPMGYRLDTTFLRDKRETYDEAIRLAAESDDWRACAGFIEDIKSRALRSVLGRERSLDEASDSLKARFDGLSRELDSLDYDAFRGNVAVAEVAQRRARLLQERADIQERLRFSNPRWRGMTAPAPWRIEEILEALEKRDQMALTLYFDGECVVSVLLGGGNGLVSVKEVGPEERAKIEAYAESLADPDRDPLASDPSRHLALGARHLVAPDVLEQALAASGLIIVPHGALHLLPWGSLIFNGKRLFEHCAVGVLPNLSCLTLLRPISTGPSVAALVGAPDYEGLSALSPLPAASDELAAIARIYGDDLLETPLTGERATEEAFRSLAGDPAAEDGVLHVVCHGTPEPSEPAYSGLLLTGSRVDAGEIANLSIYYGDVVLSACSTGWRPTRVGELVLEGDDLLGLPAAFLEAGAAAVLVSIPPADDEAASRLTVAYHRSRKAGGTPMESLRTAQMEMLEAGEYPEWSWAGFVLYGCS